MATKFMTDIGPDCYWNEQTVVRDTLLQSARVRAEHPSYLSLLPTWYNINSVRSYTLARLDQYDLARYLIPVLPMSHQSAI